MADEVLRLEAKTFQVAADFGHELEAVGWMVVTAESCTGGAIARALTEIGGSSRWFERGFVTYSNEAKQELIGVSALSLTAHGAVSEVVAREMAQGALRHSHAQLAISVTGVAGPSGGSAEKPVGTVCFGWATVDRVESRTVHFAGDRVMIRLQTAILAMQVACGWLPSQRPGGLVA